MPDSKPKPPDLDLIRMVQQARMQHDREALPSNMSAVYWIESKPLNASATPSSRTGEWIIETTASEVDNLWVKIRQATEAGQLSYKSKVSTVAVKGQTDSSARRIVVAIRDADDTSDVARVEKMLRDMGISTMRYERVIDR